MLPSWRLVRSPEALFPTRFHEIFSRCSTFAGRSTSRTRSPLYARRQLCDYITQPRNAYRESRLINIQVYPGSPVPPREALTGYESEYLLPFANLRRHEIRFFPYSISFCTLLYCETAAGVNSIPLVLYFGISFSDFVNCYIIENYIIKTNDIVEKN